ncbi:HD domain-containing protein [Chloroflexota bacterium]
MNREEALESVKANVESGDQIKHMLATEAIMRALARRLGEDEGKWGLTGLVHDIDIELIEGDMNSHSKLGADLVREMGASEAVTHAVLCHNWRHGIPCETKLDKALLCSDAVSKLIMAVATARPDKKLAGVEVESVSGGFKKKSFAVEADRQRIEACRELGIELEDYLELGLVAMKGIAEKLGL